MGIMPLRYRLAYTPRRTDMLWFGQVATKREMADGGRNGPAGIMIIWENASPSHPSPSYPQRRSVCATRPPSPRVMPAIHPICPAPGPAHASPASSSLAQHGQPVRLVALCRARRPPEVRRAETRPGSRRPVQCCVRSSALLSQIANTRPLRSPACSSSSLPASRNWHRRPVRPSRSFTTAIPTMPRTRRIMLPCTIHSHHPAHTSPHIFFFLRLPWRPTAMYRRQGGLPPYRGARLHQPAPDVAHKAADKHASSPRLPKHWPQPVQSRPKRASPISPQPETRLPAPIIQRPGS